MESSMEVLQRVKNKTAVWSSNHTSGCTSKRNENWILKRYLHAYVYYSIIHNGQDGLLINSQPKWLSVDEWIKMFIHSSSHYPLSVTLWSFSSLQSTAGQKQMVFLLVYHQKVNSSLTSTTSLRLITQAFIISHHHKGKGEYGTIRYLAERERDRKTTST